MRMIHATPARNLESILQHGLLADSSQGSKLTVWLCTPGLKGWAVEHCMMRHKAKRWEVVVIEVEVPDRWLERSTHRGRKHTGGRDVPRERILGLLLGDT